jgi:uncharacterized protein YcfJ
MKALIAGLALAATVVGVTAGPAAARHGPEYVCSQSGSKRSQDAVLGAVAGGVVGNQVAPTGKRMEGTFIGAAAGAVLGAQVGKNQAGTHCRYVGGYRGRAYYGGRYEPEYRHDNGRHRGWYKHHDHDDDDDD